MVGLRVRMKGNWDLVLGLGLRIWGCGEKCRDGGEEKGKPFLVSESIPVTAAK